MNEVIRFTNYSLLFLHPTKAIFPFNLKEFIVHLTYSFPIRFYSHYYDLNFLTQPAIIYYHQIVTAFYHLTHQQLAFNFILWLNFYPSDLLGSIIFYHLSLALSFHLSQERTNHPIANYQEAHPQHLLFINQFDLNLIHLFILVITLFHFNA